ncbi:MAG: hypothetical protein NVS4B7_15110 [Ktedonobacteraceae bacterium]
MAASPLAGITAYIPVQTRGALPVSQRQGTRGLALEWLHLRKKVGDSGITLEKGCLTQIARQPFSKRRA